MNRVANLGRGRSVRASRALLVGVAAALVSGWWVGPDLDPSCSVVATRALVVNSPCGHQWVKESGMYVTTVFVDAQPGPAVQVGTVYACASGHKFKPTESVDARGYYHHRTAASNNCQGRARRYGR